MLIVIVAAVTVWILAVAVLAISVSIVAVSVVTGVAARSYASSHVISTPSSLIRLLLSRVIMRLRILTRELTIRVLIVVFAG
jgi:hypothetical protein